MWDEGRGPRRGGGGGWNPFGMDWNFGPGEPGERGGGGGRRGRVFDAGELRVVMLKLIVDEPRHGYDLIREIEDMTGGAYAPSPGVVYPTLTMLDEMGLIEEQASEGSKRRYAATDEGRRHLDDHRAQVDSLLTRLRAMNTRRERSASGAPIQRAMVNLGIALKHRLGRGDFGPDTLHELSDLIDDLARRIERLP